MLSTGGFGVRWGRKPPGWGGGEGSVCDTRARVCRCVSVPRCAYGGGEKELYTISLT